MFSDGSKSDLGDILESSHTDLVGLAAMAEKEMGK
jgi:hypothetical protein